MVLKRTWLCLHLIKTSLQAPQGVQVKTKIKAEKNPAYGRQRISRPMRIVGPIQFWRKKTGKTLGKPRENPGKTLGTSQENPGKTPGKPQANPRKTPGRGGEGGGRNSGEFLITFNVVLSLNPWNCIALHCIDSIVVSLLWHLPESEAMVFAQLIQSINSEWIICRFFWNPFLRNFVVWW